MAIKSFEGRSTDTVVIGGGPAGLGLAVAADKRKELERLAQTGIVYFDNRPLDQFGGGSLDYDIPSNSQAGEFVCVGEEGSLSVVRDTAAARALLALGEKLTRLTDVQAYMRELGKRVAEVLSEFPNSGVVAETQIVGINHEESDLDNKRFTVHASDGKSWRARNAILAAGAQEQEIDLGENSGKIVLSSEILRGNQIDDIKEKLIANPQAEIVILGGSHSAFSVAWKLLDSLPGDLVKEGQIKILYRSDVKLFYDKVEEARADGYEFDEKLDVCGRTQRVFRYSGIRGNSKELYKNIVSGGEKRVKLEKYDGNVQENPKSREILDRAKVLVQSFGHKARKIPIYGPDGLEIGPLIDNSGKVVVDDYAGVAGLNRKLIQGVFALGLGHGRKPSKRTGGEPSAKNPVDSVNYFHKEIATDILNQIITY